MLLGASRFLLPIYTILFWQQQAFNSNISDQAPSSTKIY